MLKLKINNTENQMAVLATITDATILLPMSDFTTNFLTGQLPAR